MSYTFNPLSRRIAALLFCATSSVVAAGCSDPSTSHDPASPDVQSPRTLSQALDTFGTGDGSDGPLVVAAAGTIVNRYASLDADAAANSSALTLGAGQGVLFGANDLVMVWQVKSTAAFVSGDQDAVDPVSANVGHYELARVSAVNVDTLTLTGVLQNSYETAGATQVVRIPEYTTATIAPATSVVAQAWDGSTGGVAAFLVQGALTNDGSVDVSAQGHRGGSRSQNKYDGGFYANSILINPSCGHGRIGEGVDANPPECGRGNRGTGAGGGGEVNAGGGGGGNGARGGGEGPSWPDFPSDAGGYGGAAFAGRVVEHLSFGGGGGGGQQNNTSGRAGSPGGGVIYIRAASITGGGT